MKIFHLKIYTLIFGLMLMFISCKKVLTEDQLRHVDVSIFQRNTSLINVFSTLNNGYASDEDLNLVIKKYQELDLKERFSGELKNKFGMPLWDISISLKNINGLFTIIVPFEKNYSGKQLLLFAYFDSKNSIKFKLIDDQKIENKFRNVSNYNGTSFTKNTLKWLFDLGRINQNKYYNGLNNQTSSNGIKGNSAYVEWECWYSYGWNQNGDFWMTNQQCRYTIRVSGGSLMTEEPNHEINGGGGGGGGGSNPSGPTPNQLGKALYDKINQVNDTCLRKIVAKIGSSIFNDDLSKSFVDNFINLGSASNIVFRENQFITSGVPAWSFKDPYSTSWIVEINPNSFDNASAEYITSVIAHEIVHYYIEEYFQSQTVSISTGYNHHYNMFTNWVNSIGAMLQSIHPSLSQLNARALALGGMNDVLGSSIKEVGFSSSFNNFAIANYGISISDANSIRTMYELGISGASKCNLK